MSIVLFLLQVLAVWQMGGGGGGRQTSDIQGPADISAFHRRERVLERVGGKSVRQVSQ